MAEVGGVGDFLGAGAWLEMDREDKVSQGQEISLVLAGWRGRGRFRLGR